MFFLLPYCILYIVFMFNEVECKCLRCSVDAESSTLFSQASTILKARLVKSGSIRVDFSTRCLCLILCYFDVDANESL